MRMLVLGAGLQGAACAFDLLSVAGVDDVRLADLRVDDLPAFLGGFAGGRLTALPLDVRDRAAVLGAMDGCAAVMSAVPYYLNAPLAALAVEAGAHFCDLGGNTEIVQEQKRLDGEARRRGVSVVPDCGLAPGLVNIVAQHGMAQLDRRRGSPPLRRRPAPTPGAAPQLPGGLFPRGGARLLHDQVVGPARRGQDQRGGPLRGRGRPVSRRPWGASRPSTPPGASPRWRFRYEGQIAGDGVQDPALPRPRPHSSRRCASWGSSRPTRWRSRARASCPATWRLPLMGPRLRKPQAPDLVAVRVVVRGEKGGHAEDPESGNSSTAWTRPTGSRAMMRTTGYSLAITAVHAGARRHRGGCPHPRRVHARRALHGGVGPARGIDIRQVTR